MLCTAQQQCDSSVYVYVKKRVLQCLKQELVEEESASMHRTEKAPIITWHFGGTWLKCGCSVQLLCHVLTYGLVHSGLHSLKSLAAKSQ